MLVHYWALESLHEKGRYSEFARSAEKPTVPEGMYSEWMLVDHKFAAERFPASDGWFVMPIQRDDQLMLPDAWPSFTWKPTTAQRHQAQVNFNGRTLEQIAEGGGARWEELLAILECNPWRRLVLYRAFTRCRDWPKSSV